MLLLNTIWPHSLSDWILTSFWQYVLGTPGSKDLIQADLQTAVDKMSNAFKRLVCMISNCGRIYIFMYQVKEHRGEKLRNEDRALSGAAFAGVNININVF